MSCTRRPSSRSGSSSRATSLALIAVFVPVKYLYPTKVQPALLRHSLGVGALVWIGVLVGCIEWPEKMGALPWLELSLAYPAWYLWLSLRRGGLVRHPGRVD